MSTDNNQNNVNNKVNAFLENSAKMTPYVASSVLLSGVYYSAFHMYSDSVESSDWIFLYRFFQCAITTHLMTLSWITKSSNTNMFAIGVYFTSLVSFYSMATLVLYNDYFIEMRNQPDFKIIQDTFYTSITTMVQYFILWESKTNIQHGINLF